MKLIIDIPEKTIQHIRSDYGHGIKGIKFEDRDKIVDAIYYGIPLDSVKDEINEIEEEYCDLCAGYCGISKQAVMDILCVQKVRKNEEKA